MTGNRHLSLGSEFGFIKSVRDLYGNRIPEGYIGIGDDCATLPPSRCGLTIISKDLLLEGTHFLMEKTSAYALGYKALAVNLSDIAAMGGDPESFFVGIGVPASLPKEWLSEFYDGLDSLATLHNVSLLGGDTTRSQNGVVISITVTGVVEEEKVKYRSGAAPGDKIAVTGTLGDSCAGLRLLQGGIEIDGGEYLLNAHRTPEPHVDEGIFLSKFSQVTAMIDVSDGLEGDLRHIAEESKTGALLFSEAIPLSAELLAASHFLGWDPVEMALTGGEDYTLLVTISANGWNEVCDEFMRRFHHPLHLIGEVVSAEEGIKCLTPKGDLLHGKGGFDHFAADKGRR